MGHSPSEFTHFLIHDTEMSLNPYGESQLKSLNKLFIFQKQGIKKGLHGMCLAPAH